MYTCEYARTIRPKKTRISHGRVGIKTRVHQNSVFLLQFEKKGAKFRQGFIKSMSISGSDLSSLNSSIFFILFSLMSKEDSCYFTYLHSRRSIYMLNASYILNKINSSYSYSEANGAALRKLMYCLSKHSSIIK